MNAKTIAVILLVAVAALSGQAVTQIILEHQVKLLKPALPGAPIVVGPDRISLAPASGAELTSYVMGTPSSPGCVATSTAGVYSVALKFSMLTVYRNGLRLSSASDYAINGQSVTIANAQPGDTVLCDLLVDWKALTP